MKTVMVTGGAGFIGSNFARMMLEKYPDYHIVVYDKLTYAGNPENLRDLHGDPRFLFVVGDIADAAKVEATIHDFGVDYIVNFAAETHVDRSIMDPGSFIQTNVFGVYTLLEATRKRNGDDPGTLLNLALGYARAGRNDAVKPLCQLIAGNPDASPSVKEQAARLVRTL